MIQPHPTKRRLQFTLVTLFILMLCVAGTLSGYRVGFDQGYVRGERKRQSEAPFPKVYAVADLVKPQVDDPSAALPNYDTLIELIQQIIAPDSWADAGGSGAIESFPTNLSLVIRQTEDVHEQIESLLTKIRAANASSHTND